ncbi:hypothetical protein [Pleionea mediterranea]|uniref:Uncharacterized protein n=1 Tax=Pleionea mediterranea TaxID=523701 RepID=A0A316FY33_9GAMM|nr:hypothetical protein [Pleionea mediterranea]PWK53323.1 hypothetical protein C8D97_103150 [Pleionea mediterranea]
MKLLIAVSWAFAMNIVYAQECEYTKEYSNLVEDVKESLIGSKSEYFKCKESIRVANYWKAIANCTKQGRGNSVAGGCYHIVGNSTEKNEISNKHCDALKPIDFESTMYFNIKHQQRKYNIKKCKDNNQSQQEK